MTPEQLEKANNLNNQIRLVSQNLEQLRDNDFYVCPMLSMKSCGAYPAYIGVTEQIRRTIELLVKADLQYQLENLQREFKAL